MAEVQSSSNDKHNKVGVTKSKKLSTRVDLTPMVDLGFLLITFFIFTTSLSEPKTMGLVLPKDSTDSIAVAQGKVLNLLLAENDKLFYYHGDNIGEMNCTNFSAKGLRSIIRDKQEAVKNIYGDKKETIIIIRPSSGCSYKNVVDVLDEIIITDIKKYVLMDEYGANEALASVRNKGCN